MRNIVKTTAVLISLLSAGSTYGLDSLNVKKLSQWESGGATIYNEVWGFVQDGREYGVLGAWEGTYIVDVTDPVNPVLADYVPGAYQTCIHRDYHDYAGYLYMVADEGDNTSTLQIADLSFLPDSVSIVYDSYALFNKSHNIFIDSSNARLYTCGGNMNNGLRVFSLADPVNPVELINYTTVGNYVHDVFVRRDTVYAHAGNFGMYVYDFSNVGSPQLIGSLTFYPHQGYNHSGWLNQAGNTYVFADETPGMDVKVADVSDLTDIKVLDTINSGGNSNSVAHNPIIKGNFVYISYYQDGMWIFNISDPANTTVAGFYDTYTDPEDTIVFGGAWGVYPFLPSGNILVSDRRHGLFVLDASEAVAGMVANQPGQQGVFLEPNPAGDHFDIHFSEQVVIRSIRVVDLAGRVVEYSEPVFSGTVFSYRSSGLISGCYMVLITTDQGNMAGKMNIDY